MNLWAAGRVPATASRRKAARANFFMKIEYRKTMGLRVSSFGLFYKQNKNWTRCERALRLVIYIPLFGKQ